ncbi:collagen alpha-1(I) chain-like [Sus scrofa]|uniref:collagen alpha-1(I) chain-like n=1 Tax=Sus scrofa TaxID=9823 RepID=UPI000A2B1E6D|nr:collagen alpha-1(I) chain-like [Sus scrofa]
MPPEKHKGLEQKQRGEEESGRGVLCFALFCTPSPEPRAAPVLTRWSGEPVLLRGRGARAAGTRRRGGPRARGATTSSSPSGCGRGPKELEKEPGEGEKRSSISSSSTPPKRPSSRDPGGPPDPRALAQPLRPPRLCASPKASPKPAGAGGSAPAAGPVRCRGGRGRPGSQGLLTGTTVSRGRNHGVSPSPRRGGRSSSPLSGSTSGRRAGPAPIPVHQPSRDAWGDRGSPAAPPHWPDGPAAPAPHEERGRPGDGRPGSHDNGCLGPGFSRSSGLPGAQVDRHAAAFLPRRGGLLILGGGENAPRPPPHLQLQKQKLRALGRARQRGKTPSRPSSVSPHGPPPVPCLASSLVSLFSPGGFGL